jgi:hypothetical protein
MEFLKAAKMDFSQDVSLKFGIQSNPDLYPPIIHEFHE